jgi:hypothetical protein
MARHSSIFKGNEMREVIAKVNRDIRLLQIIAANAVLFPNSFSMEWYGVNVYYYGKDAKTEIATAIRILRRFTGGTVTKKYDDHYFTAKITLPNDGGEIQLMTSRETVCRLVPTGEMETVEEIDYKSAPTITVEREIKKWECDSVLLDA